MNQWHFLFDQKPLTILHCFVFMSAKVVSWSFQIIFAILFAAVKLGWSPDATLFLNSLCWLRICWIWAAVKVTATGVLQVEGKSWTSLNKLSKLWALSEQILNYSSVVARNVYFRSTAFIGAPVHCLTRNSDCWAEKQGKYFDRHFKTLSDWTPTISSLNLTELLKTFDF